MSHHFCKPAGITISGLVLQWMMEGHRISLELESLVLEISANCSLACTMCGFGNRPIDPSMHMSSTLISRVLENVSSQVREIRLNGRGESTINPHFTEIVKDVRDQFPSTTLSLFTNLMFRSESLLDTLKQMDVMLFVSIDSAHKEVYESIRKGSSFDRLQNRLRFIDDAILVFTLQPDNFSEIASVGKLASTNGFGFILNVVRTDDSSFRTRFQTILDNHWDVIIEQLQSCVSDLGDMALIPDYIWNYHVPNNIANAVTCGSLISCPIARTEIMVGYDGLVYPCNMFNPTILGNLALEDLDSIIRGNTRKQFITSHKDHYYCRNCAYILKV